MNTSVWQRDDSIVHDHEAVPRERTDGLVVEVTELLRHVGDESERRRTALPE
jgi:hypothetical protein